MGTSKYVAISLIVALAGIVAAGQDQPAASSQTVPPAPSNTRFASCLVRITVDPAIMPLSPGTVSNLIHSPAVLLKAERDVLSLNTPEDLDRLNKPQDSGRSLIVIGWLSASSASMSLGGRVPGQGDDARADEEMMRELEKAYGSRSAARARTSDAAAATARRGGCKLSPPGCPSPAGATPGTTQEG